MMTVMMKKYCAIAKQYYDNLNGMDPRFNNYYVMVTMNDMSNFVYSNAFALICDEYYFVFTEHNGVHVFCEDEVKVIQLERKAITSYYHA